MPGQQHGHGGRGTQGLSRGQPGGPSGPQLLWHLRLGASGAKSRRLGSSPTCSPSSQPLGSGLETPICKVSIFPTLPTAGGDSRAPGKTGLSVLPELDTLEWGHLFSGREVVQILSLSTAKGIRAVSGLGEGKESQGQYTSLPYTHTHRIGTLTTRGQHGSRARSRLRGHPHPQRLDSWGPPATGPGCGQALADSSCPPAHLCSHFTEWETGAQAAGHRARDQDSEIQVTETGAGQGGPCDQMKSEAEGGKGPAEVTC